jgi:hypothetical protein
VTSNRIWPATDGPNNEDNGDPVTLGTRFILSATGWITHLHFFRGTTNDTGTHTGGVFKKSDSSPVAGTQITIPATGTGWQTVALPAAVQVPADTYVVAALHPDGHPCFTGGYWGVGGPGGAGITNGILTAPSDAAISGQGVYVGGGTFACPTNSFNQANYWTDVTVSDVDPAAPIEDSAADNVGLTDAATTAMDWQRLPAETVGLTDASTAAMDWQRTAGDTAGATDAATAALDWQRTTADTAGLTDTAVAVMDYVREPADPVGLTDQAATVFDFVRAPSDLAGLTDAAVAALDAVRTVADIAGLTDSVTAVLSTPGQPDPDWDFALGPPHSDWSLGPPHA